MEEFKSYTFRERKTNTFWSNTYPVLKTFSCFLHVLILFSFRYFGIFENIFVLKIPTMMIIILTLIFLLVRRQEHYIS